MDPLIATYHAVLFNPWKEGRSRWSPTAPVTNQTHPLQGDEPRVPTMGTQGGIASVTHEDAGNGCFLLQDTEVEEIVFKP